MIKYIDTEELIQALFQNVEDLYQRGWNDALRLAVNYASAADVVEVVRCKDCKHRDAEKGFCEGRGWPMQLVPDDGFCDKGERRA